MLEKFPRNSDLVVPFPSPSLAEDILQAIETLVCVMNSQGQMVYVSPAVERILGYTPQEVLGDAWWRLVYSKDVAFGERTRQRLASIAGGESAVDTEAHTARAFTRSGQERWIAWRDAKGPGDLVIGVGQDITELQRARNAMEVREQEFRAIFDHASEGMMITNCDWIYEEANQAACHILGVDLNQIIGHVQGTVRPSSIDFSLIHERALREGTVVTELGFERAEGDHRTLEISISTNVCGDRHLIIQRDITERRRLQQQLEEAHRLEAVGRLAGGVAHDFNNMLTAIRGYSELLRRNAVDDRQKRYVDALLGACLRAEQTTHQLLAFSRKQVLSPKLLNLNDAITEVIQLLHRVIGEDVVLVSLLCEEPCEVVVDPGQFTQIMLNLAVNSRDAMPKGGKLIIETRCVELNDDYVLKHVRVQPGSYVLLAVTDTGIGIPPEVLPHIFEPFFTTKEVGKGTGLGLATVYGIVKQSRGYVWVYSEEGQGTTFKIYLPRAVKNAPGADRPGQSASNILVIEDDDQMRTVIAEQLKADGYHVLSAADGTEALQQCEAFEGNLDLLLTDVTSSRMSGDDLMGYFTIRYPEMVVIHMSGFSRAKLEEAHQIAPGAFFLSKPFTAEQLRQTIRAASPGREERSPLES